MCVCVCVCIKSCRTIYCRVVATRCHKTPQMALEKATDWRHRMLQRARVIASVVAQLPTGVAIQPLPQCSGCFNASRCRILQARSMTYSQFTISRPPHVPLYCSSSAKKCTFLWNLRNSVKYVISGRFQCVYSVAFLLIFYCSGGAQCSFSVPFVVVSKQTPMPILIWRTDDQPYLYWSVMTKGGSVAEWLACWTQAQ